MVLEQTELSNWKEFAQTTCGCSKAKEKPCKDGLYAVTMFYVHGMYYA